MKTHSEYPLISSPSASLRVGNPVLTPTSFPDCLANPAASIWPALMAEAAVCKGSGSLASAYLDLDWNGKQTRIWLILTICDLGLFSLNC